ncbi:MAG TPA: PilN domain-containing protein [Candidatus Saccharimonadales bacterium]|nr:PilN domain-containing protein [Candidatus Saccharimonadales bacterium]
MINLLPSEKKNHYQLTSRVYFIISIYIASIALIGLILAGMFGYNLMSQSKITNKQSQLDALNSQAKQSNDIVAQAAFVEDRLKSASQYQDKEKWDEVVGAIASATPTTIQLTDLKVAADATNKSLITVTLAGVSPDRRNVVLYEEKLALNQSFVGPTIQSLAQVAGTTSQQFSFSIQFTYQGAVAQ